MKARNIYQKIPAKLAKEEFTNLLQDPSVRIERIVTQGHATPEGEWYDQDQHEWVIILEGSAKLRFEDYVMDLKKGDYVNIPAHTHHRVDWTDPNMHTVWLAIFY